MMAPIALLMCFCLAVGVFGEDRQVLVFGGNGFLGGSTVELLLQHGDNVTMVNRGNWYWDSKSRILPHLRHIKFDRKEKLESCKELMEFISETEKFDLVVDFSAFGEHEVKEAAAALKDKPQLYVLFSSDTVYDVSDKKSDGPSQETDAVRPMSKEEVERMRHYHTRGHNKLDAEEALMEQRVNEGFPFVILRLPDILGPRDTTYRFWLYQLWIKLSQVIKDKPILVPDFLENYKMSFIYSEDIPEAVLQLLSVGPQVNDQAINLAYPETYTLTDLITEIQDVLDISEDTFIIQDPDIKNHAYFYPTARRGPINVDKAGNLLNWSPTPWKEMIKETVTFYENAMANGKFDQQRDEIIQILGHHVYNEDLPAFYDALEEIYKIDLKHFKIIKDEL